MIVGGILYTVGGYVYTTETPNPYPGRFGFHENMAPCRCVVAAAGIHWLMMYFVCIALPRLGPFSSFR